MTTWRAGATTRALTCQRDQGWCCVRARSGMCVCPVPSLPLQHSTAGMTSITPSCHLGSQMLLLEVAHPGMLGGP